MMTIFKKVTKKIIEEVELHIENVEVKSHGIISKVGSIEDQGQRIEDSIFLKIRWMTLV
jgi:hypothetical protein